MSEKIIVIGVGNVLMTDEGVGVRVAERLISGYTFPDNVEVYDGGATGMHGLLPLIEEADHLIVIDAVNGPGRPGEVYRYDGDTFRRVIPKKLSAHDVGLVECLTIADINGRAPKTVTVIGVQPEDIITWGMELTPAIAAKVDELAAMTLEELKRLGVGDEGILR